MGCFMALRGRKKKSLQQTEIRPVNPQEQSPTVLLEHQNQQSVRSAPSSFRTRVEHGPFDTSEPLPMPRTLPPSLSTKGNLINFSFEEITSACNNFSPERYMSESLSSVNYHASFLEDPTGSRRIEASVTRLHPSNQGLKEFKNNVKTLSSLQHPFLCKLIGFHAMEGSENRMLVYERLYHGSLDRILFGRSDGPTMDWSTRMKVILCAAHGLTFLHEEGPFQAMYHEFSTANIQVDKDFSAKLSGYGCISHIPEIDTSRRSPIMANLSAETLEKGLLTPKSNVWSFGIVLLELLTGRKNLDVRHPNAGRDLVKWSRPLLADDGGLSLIMDPQLKGRFPAKAARAVADIAQLCLQVDPSERPTMRTIVDHLKTIQEIKYTTRFPLQDPGEISRKYMSKSSSTNGIMVRGSSTNSSPSLPMISLTRMSAMPLALPPRTRSVLPLEELHRQERRRSSSTFAGSSCVERF